LLSPLKEEITPMFSKAGLRDKVPIVVSSPDAAKTGDGIRTSSIERRVKIVAMILPNLAIIFTSLNSDRYR
jgi:hypothetical protein